MRLPRFSIVGANRSMYHVRVGTIETIESHVTCRHMHVAFLAGGMRNIRIRLSVRCHYEFIEQ